MGTTWFRRGDKDAEGNWVDFAVEEGSEAWRSLSESGARQIDGPSAPDGDGEASVAEPTKADLQARAAELGLSLPSRANKAAISAAIGEAEAAARAAEAEAAAAAASPEATPETEG